MMFAKLRIAFVVIALAVFLLYAPQAFSAEYLSPVLSISPREVNLGNIAPGDANSGLFTLKNMGSGSLEWSVRKPEGWRHRSGEEMFSIMPAKSDYLRVEVSSLPDEEQLADESSDDAALHLVEMKLEGEAQSVTFYKKLSEGMHKEAIRISSNGGDRTIFVAFSISASAGSGSLINLNPKRIDMGSVLPGKTVSKRIMLTNKGKDRLEWSVAVEKPKRKEKAADFKKGRYISFHNDEVINKNVYSAPAHLKEIMELSGRWTETDGYPSGAEGDNIIRLNFSGTGIILYLATFPEGSGFHVYVDERPVSSRSWPSEFKEKKGELLIAEDLAEGSHVLTMVSKDSRLVFEGVKILGKNISRAPAGKTSIVPISGTILTQTNYLRVTFNSTGLAPGYYSDNIIFTGNGGEEVVELFAEVIPESAGRDIDIYRYSRGEDYLFTAFPSQDTAQFGRKNYTKDGIAFRLFASGTPGTTPFYRWYNAQKRDHFYHHDQAGGGKNIQGYTFEGSIGNIGTSKLTNTRELYRWYNASSGRYLYITDSRAAGLRSKGYSFDGIAGYVK
ncbi:MAG: hypothetical protein JW914_00540 [Syntrophaceae bacterium]|nr:hypothetical protein [Syntrophaceae bacterium]